MLIAIGIQLLTACAGGKEHTPPFSDLAWDGSNNEVAVAVQARKEDPSGKGTPGQRCLNEGEPCSTLNSECCPGLRCPMGLDPKCVPNP